jgi:hypothetical protein
MPLNVFVIGLDEFNMDMIRTIEGYERYRFHKVLDLERIQTTDHYPVAQWLDEARQQLDAFDGSIDGVMGFWDFPVSTMVPILCHEYDLPGPRLQAVARCEHKYWSRLEQAQAIPEHVPGFDRVDPFADVDETLSRLELRFPLWIKPIKAFASQLGFRLDGPEALREAIGEIREKIGRFGGPFDQMLERVDLPPEVARMPGSSCIVEELIRGQQHTIAGYSHAGEVRTYGAIDSVNYPDTSTFFRYRYPSRLPAEIKDRMARLTRRVIRQMGFDNSPFNVEYFYDPERDRLTLLEINTRISQSHSDLFHKVDGASNHQVAVELATGQRPAPEHREGRYRVASKFILARFADGVVRKIPGPERIAEIEAEIPDARILIRIPEGARLSELPGQEPYSYRLAVIYLGADSDEELLARYERCVEALDLEIEDV